MKAAIEDGASFSVQNDLDNTPLCIAASAGHLDIVKILVEKGADVHQPGYCEMAPLTLAARDGRLEVVMYLIAHGAASVEREVNDAINVGSMSAFGRDDIVDLLKDARLKAVAPAPRGLSDADARMMQAAATGDAVAVKAAIEAGADVAVHDDRGMDALSWAALRGHDATLRVLLDHGADINGLNSSGWPPLGQACGQGKLNVVKVLVERGVDVNITFDGGRTALMCAAYQGYIDIVELLLKAGADATMEYEGMTARDLAAQRGNAAIAAMLGEGSRGP